VPFHGRGRPLLRYLVLLHADCCGPAARLAVECEQGLASRAHDELEHITDNTNVSSDHSKRAAPAVTLTERDLSVSAVLRVSEPIPQTLACPSPKSPAVQEARARTTAILCEVLIHALIVLVTLEVLAGDERLYAVLDHLPCGNTSDIGHAPAAFLCTTGRGTCPTTSACKRGGSGKPWGRA
jgi:hypothetical protein